jgi:S-adenosylmethionine hydrolase
MKGVILSGGGNVTLVDLTHEIPPQDVVAARAFLSEVWRMFPEGTIHLGVVDPGVGTGRRRLLIEAAGRLLLGPDNGILGFTADVPGVRFREVIVESPPSFTFEGRDVFALTAARLCRGEAIGDLSREFVGPIESLTPAVPTPGDGFVRGEIVGIDRFGNLISNVLKTDLPVGATFVRGPKGEVFRWVRTYAEGRDSEPVALWNGSGRLEVAVRNGSARDVVGASQGMTISVERKS